MKPKQDRDWGYGDEIGVEAPPDGATRIFEWRGGQASFRGRVVEFRPVVIAGMTLRVAAMKDATELLDEPDFAKRFIENDIAPYGVELWPAAIMLAEYIAYASVCPKTPLLIRGRGQGEGAPGCKPDRNIASSASSRPVRAIELGCGLGLVAIVAARLGWQVTASDYEPTALAFAGYNARLNGAAVAEWVPLDWHNPPADRQFDVILGADILYQLVDHTPIISCISRMLAPQGVALIADPNRGVADRFAQTAEAAGFSVETIACAGPKTGKPTNGGRIFRLRGGAGERERVDLAIW